MNSNQLISDLSNRDTRTLMQVALGQRPADLAVVNARVANVFTAEILDRQAVVTHGKWIAYTGDNPDGMIGPQTEVIDAAGRVVIPGLIDGHTHLALLYNIAEFIRHAAPGGTTTVITETFEPYAVGGYDGLTDFLKSLADQPIKLFATVPPMVSISQRLAGMPSVDLSRLLARQEVLGLGESYWQGVLQSPETFLPAMQATLSIGKKLEGHSAGARGNKLAAYAALGISSCHEPITAEEALARMRLGLHVMAREGNVRRDLAAISGISDTGVDLRRLTLVSDGVDPKILIEEGYMETVVQKAIQYGFAPMEAIRMTTLNVAEHFGIDHLVGAIAPGRYADLILIPDIDTIRAELVISNGRVIARDGRLTVEPRRHRYAEHNPLRTLPPLTAADFAIPADPAADAVDVRVIEMVTDLVTREKVMTAKVTEGEVQISLRRDLVKVTAIERRLTPGRRFTGLIHGFGLGAGAFASSLAWDSACMIGVGADDEDMAHCMNRIRELNGGVVVCRNRQVLAELPLPVMGIISELTMTALAEGLAAIHQAVQQLGVAFADPLLSLQTLTGAAIPFLRICEDGLVDLKSGAVKGVIPRKQRY